MHRAVTERKISAAQRGRLIGVTLLEGGRGRSGAGRRWAQGGGSTDSREGQET